MSPERPSRARPYSALTKVPKTWEKGAMSRHRTIRRHALEREKDRVELCLVRKDGIFGGFNVQESGKGPTRMLSWRWTRESEATGILMARMRTLQSLGFVALHPGAQQPKSEPDGRAKPAGRPTTTPRVAMDWEAAVERAVAGDTGPLESAVASLDENALAQALGLDALTLSADPPPSRCQRLAAALPALRGLDQPWVGSWLRSRSVMLQVEPSTLASWLRAPGPWADALADAVAEHGPALLGPELASVPESTESTVVAEAATHWLARMEPT